MRRDKESCHGGGKGLRVRRRTTDVIVTVGTILLLLLLGLGRALGDAKYAQVRSAVVDVVLALVARCRKEEDARLTCLPHVDRIVNIVDRAVVDSSPQVIRLATQARQEIHHARLV